MFQQRKYRKIDFKPPLKPSNGFQNGKLVQSPHRPANGAPSPSSTNQQPQKKKARVNSEGQQKIPDDGVSGPVPGMFDPSLVTVNMHWTTLSRAGPGLFNQGNTCFLNSTLQCLLHTPAFTQILLNEPKAALLGMERRGNENDQKPILLHYQRYASILPPPPPYLLPPSPALPHAPLPITAVCCDHQFTNSSNTPLFCCCAHPHTHKLTQSALVTTLGW